MNPARWERVHQIVAEALDRPLETRQAFVDLMTDDPEVRTEVRSAARRRERRRLSGGVARRARRTRRRPLRAGRPFGGALSHREIAGPGRHGRGLRGPRRRARDHRRAQDPARAGIAHVRVRAPEDRRHAGARRVASERLPRVRGGAARRAVLPGDGTAARADLAAVPARGRAVRAGAFFAHCFRGWRRARRRASRRDRAPRPEARERHAGHGRRTCGRHGLRHGPRRAREFSRARDGRRHARLHGARAVPRRGGRSRRDVYALGLLLCASS
jgi:hypothetical protein